MTNDGSASISHVQAPTQQSARPSFGCGAMSGLAVTAALNPWDRALYLSVLHKRPFLSAANFRDPYRGFCQTVAGRVVSNGMYFPLEAWFAQQLDSHTFGGQAAAVTIGVSLNPLNLIKFQTWSSPEPRPFLAQARHMYHSAGALVFARGIVATIARDSTFGVIFSARKLLPADSDRSTRFLASVLSAGVATTLSSPFNYLRNLAYGESVNKPLETVETKVQFWKKVLSELMRDAKAQPSLAGSLHLLQRRLVLGWGTARVAFGMAVTDYLYMCCSEMRNAS
eukprot:TRINITY_DN46982_c0_g1_i1.p1 TRINITY_DN46982_c0_g1~~TRINITY_DN46982_c0_g1_i1.p1  ORF type:complete len:282 (-),score=42.56 TRINITY_DN46982_c0_g1_i1:163-1008(-)